MNAEVLQKNEVILLGLKVKDMMKKRRRKRFGDRQVNRSTMPRGWDPTSCPVSHLTGVTARNLQARSGPFKAQPADHLLPMICARDLSRVESAGTNRRISDD